MNHAALEAKHSERASSDFGNAFVRATFADDKQYIFRRKQAPLNLSVLLVVFVCVFSWTRTDKCMRRPLFRIHITFCYILHVCISGSQNFAAAMNTVSGTHTSCFGSCFAAESVIQI
jgi:hypothetical protein